MYYLSQSVPSTLLVGSMLPDPYMPLESGVFGCNFGKDTNLIEMPIGRFPDEVVLPLDARLHHHEGHHAEAVQHQADQSLDWA